MKIGTAVQVLPLCHPLRLAEEAATVDQISHGRLIFGVGRSGVASTYEAYGVPYDESRERFAEILDIVKQAWTEARFSYDGKYYSFDNVALSCRSRTRSRCREIRIAASTPDTFPAIGALGYPVFAAGAPSATWHELAPHIKAYHEAYKAAGHPGKGKVFVSRADLYRRDRGAGARRGARKASRISTGCNTS